MTPHHVRLSVGWSVGWLVGMSVIILSFTSHAPIGALVNYQIIFNYSKNNILLLDLFAWKEYIHM